MAYRSDEAQPKNGDANLDDLPPVVETDVFVPTVQKLVVSPYQKEAPGRLRFGSCTGSGFKRDNEAAPRSQHSVMAYLLSLSVATSVSRG